MSTKVEVGGPSQVLTRRLGISGTENPVGDVAPELVGAFVLEHDRPEWAYLAGERLQISSVQLAAGGAGLRSYARLNNPADSGVLGVVTGIYGLNDSTAMSFRLPPFASTAGETAASGAQSRDRRITQAGALTLTGNNTLSIAGLGGTFAGLLRLDGPGAATNNTFRSDEPWILPPGTSLAIIGGADNQLGHFTLWWRERRIGRYER